MKKIIVNLQGGLVCSVHLPPGLHEVVVEVRDRDLEGADDDEVFVDQSGHYVGCGCPETFMESEDNYHEDK